MAYFPDLGSTTQIASGHHVRAIGWLSPRYMYPQGPVPADFVERLRSFCARWIDSIGALNWPVCAGPHACEFCGDFYAAGNIGVPAGDALFVAPEMVAHYVEKHSYRPPREFVDAVLAAPEPGTAGYSAAVKRFAEPSGDEASPK